MFIIGLHLEHTNKIIQKKKSQKTPKDKLHKKKKQHAHTHKYAST